MAGKQTHYPVSPCNNTVAIEKQKSSITLVSFYPVTGQADNCVWSTSYKPSDSKSFILSEHFHI